jgi:hypothetical protein
MFSKPRQSKSNCDRSHQPEVRQRQRQIRQERQTPAIFSYHAKRNDNYTVSDEDDSQVQSRNRQNLADSRVKAAKTNKKHHVLLYPSLAVIFIFICYELILSISPNVIVTSDTSDSIASANTQAYRQKAAELFSKSLSSRTKLTINTKQIDAELQSNFPELETVSTTIPLLGMTPTVHVVPSKAILGDVLDDGTIIGVDSRGVDISAAGGHVNDALPKVIDHTGTRPNPGHVVVPVSTVSFIKSVMYQLKSQNFTVSGLILTLGGSELNVSLKDIGYIGKFNLQENSREQAGALAATIKSLKSQNITPASYIDVRIPGRAYYK